jgi:predicted nucleotidyltransferase
MDNHKIPDNQTPDSDWSEGGTMRSTGRQAGKTPLDKIIEVITRSADPDRIILFGSRARKDNKKSSDYDICVLKHGVSRRRQLAMQLYRDLYGIGVPVELIVETPEMFEKIKDNPFLIYHAIANQGKVIYEKPVPR